MQDDPGIIKQSNKITFLHQNALRWDNEDCPIGSFKIVLPTY